MAVGWHVFTAVHPQAPYDAIVDDGFGLKRVEVKSVCETKHKGLVCLPTHYNTPYPAGAFDYLAAIGPGGQVWMIPGEVACERSSISVESERYQQYRVS